MSFSVPDPRASVGDESSSIVSVTSSDTIPPTSPVRQPMSVDRTPDRAAQQQHSTSARQTQTGGADSLRGQDQRQYAGGQPLPPGSMAPPSPTAAPNLSAYARLMLQHTKQQLDATSALPPPPHIRVAGPLGHSQHQQRHRHTHRASLPNGTSPRINGVSAAHS